MEPAVGNAEKEVVEKAYVEGRTQSELSTPPTTILQVISSFITIVQDLFPTGEY